MPMVFGSTLTIGGLSFSAARPTLIRSPSDRPFVQPAENSRFSFRNMALQPGLPAYQLVLSVETN